MNRHKGLILFFLLLHASFFQAQDFESLPKHYPAYSQDFSDVSSYPSICFERAIQDKNGRWWLIPCGSARQQSSLFLFQFDGYDFKLVSGIIEKLPFPHDIIGIEEGHTLVGYSSSQADSNQLFFYDLLTHQLRHEEIPINGEIIGGFLTSQKTVLLVSKQGNKVSLAQWGKGDFKQLGELNSIDPRAVLIFLNEEEAWFDIREKNGELLRYQFKTNTSKKYIYSGFDPKTHSAYEGGAFPMAAPIDSKQDQVFFYYRLTSLKKGRQIELLTFNETKDLIERVERQPDLSMLGSRVFQDEVGNYLFLFLIEDGSYKAILEDTTGKRYDYSSFFTKIGRSIIFSIESEDFRNRSIICSYSGVLIQQATNTSGIQHYLPGQSIRTMLELPNGQILVSRQGAGTYLLDLNARKVERFIIPGCPFDEERNYNLFYLGEDGKLLLYFENEIIKFDHSTQSCESFTTDLDHINHFIPIDEDRLVIQSRSLGLFLYQFSTNQATPILKDGQAILTATTINGSYYDKKKWLWIASNKGLWKVDPIGQEIELLGKDNPFPDSRFLSMKSDDKGRLWLGTPLAGLNIYDPNAKTLSIINNENGLANNTIANILEDDDGDWWLGTYNGISIVNNNGELIANLSLKDGLIEKENNRFSTLKTKDGKLLIGTINGLNVIDPKMVKNRLKSTSDLKIYLTSLGYYDAKKGEKINETYQLNNLATLRLPATQRYLNLSFALSNIFNPEENQYAFMLEGKDMDWTYIGNQNELSLSSLPAGKYRLLIKGQDNSGNWTSEPIAISIHARQFFYKSLWFYLGLIFLAGLGIVIWIRRLKVKVDEATKKIREDKAIIEFQTERLKENDEAKSLFFTNISHEFRTPLTIISGLTSKMKKNPGERKDKNLDMVKRNSDNLLNLVNQILDLRKLESNKLKLNMIQADIIPYLNYLFESFESLAGSKGVQMHLLIEEGKLVMDYDPNKLLRILSNLFSNAIKFTPSGGQIYFIVRQDFEALLTIQVKDTGKGIPAKKLPHIFDRFYQADLNSTWDTTQNEGTGIGLALSKELVTLLGGTLIVESEINKGSVFTINLPITNKATKQGDVDQEISVPNESEIDGLGLTSASGVLSMLKMNENAPLVLLVEDNSDVIQYLIACLEGNFNLITAKDGQEGIEKAIEHIPDAIISDVMMPQKNGFELCDTLKTDERTSHIPIILLTAKADPDSRLTGLKKGADDYLIKPFDEEELLTRLNNQLEIRRKLQLHFQQAPQNSSPLKDDTTQEDEFLKKVRLHLEANIDQENYGIVQICHALHISRTQLHRKIKALTGESTSHFLRKIRLYKAKELLTSTDLNVSQVAYEVGFRHPNNFSNAYFEEFGIRPSETSK